MLELKMHAKKVLLIAIIVLAAFLRLRGLSTNPVSLFGDELDVGYHAYSILKTGRDYSGNFLPLHFQSLAEWRTPLYLYSSVPTVAIFGISPLGVRLPAALFGILGVWAIYLLAKVIFESLGKSKTEWMALLSALVLAINPWHIQYSRAGFEATELIAFLLFGLYFFFKAIKSDGKNLWVASVFLIFTPWIYSTAKLFTPILFAILVLFWRKEIFSFKKPEIKKALIAIFVIGIPIAYSTVFGGGAQRFGYISVFKDPTTVPEVGVARLNDARVRGEIGEGLRPTLEDRLIHNKFTLWGKRITASYLSSFSTNFLFVSGDPNPRHSLQGIGEFYRVEFLILLLGIIMFFAKFRDKKMKALLALWLIFAALPTAITQGGANHATRLILMLPPFVLLIAYGIISIVTIFDKKWGKLALVAYFGLLFINFIFYQHEYWVHYPWDSERWWHYGWKEAIQSVKKKEADYKRIFITMADEPAWIFFAANYPYPPDKWHEGFPFKDTEVPGFGGMSYIDKYYFGSPDENGASIYDLPRYITKEDLYLASAKEVPGNLIMDDSRVPIGLKLLDIVAFPSGEPAFYIFTKQ